MSRKSGQTAVSKRLVNARIAIATLLAGLALGCGDEVSPPPTFEVDPALVPEVATLPTIDGVEPRPVSVVTDDEGNHAQFVSNELWLSSDDEETLAAFVSRWNGVVLSTLDPEVDGFSGSGLPKQFLVRIDTALADTTELALDLKQLDELATGHHVVSDLGALGLFAASALEASAGLDVGINWVGTGAADFQSRQTTDAPLGPSLFGSSYEPNAFRWPSHAIDTKQNIGVAEAWRVLELAGKLDNQVKIAILDMGFFPDRDFPGGWRASSNVPFVDPVRTKNLGNCGGSPCPYHGTNVTSAAMARPDNHYGSAGPAGPVADAHLVFTSYDFFTSISAIAKARSAGARIANMSYGVPVPATFAFSVYPFDAVTSAARTSGMLIFASAGNEGKNVDATDGVGPVKWEKTWFTPCENSGVICVGGLYRDDDVLDPSSNYGAEHVDIYAPYTMWLGPDPDSAANSVQVMHGTSFSSPFVAGVAALIWAANPELSQKGVRDILYETASASSDDRVVRIVNAHDAVRAALGPVAPSIHFSYPLRDGYEMPLGTWSLSVFVEDVEDGHPCCTVTWYSDVDGYLGEGNMVSVPFDTIGTHVIEATATDSDGLESTATLVLEVVNAEPKAQILRPTAGETVLRGQPFRLRGAAADQNEPNGKLDCSALRWDSDVASDPFPQTGCDVEVIFSSVGPRTLTLIATDSQGATSVVTASLEVVAPPQNLPPIVRITSPTGGAATPWNRPSTLTGTATDPEGDEPLVYTWTVSHPLSSVPFVIGNGPTVEWTPSEIVPWECNSVAEATVRLTVRDSRGNSASDFVYLLWQLTC